MPFVKGDIHNPSKLRQRHVEKDYVVPPKDKGMSYSARVRATVLQRVSTQKVSVKQACFEAGVRDRHAPARWAKLLKETGNLKDTKHAGRPRLLEHGTESQTLLTKLVKCDPYASTSTLGCRLLIETTRSGNPIDVNKRTIQRELYERLPPGSRFQLKKHNISSTNVNQSQVLDMQMGYIEGMEDTIGNGLVSVNDMYFQDECPIRKGELPRLARKQEDSPLYGRQPYVCEKYTLLSVIGPEKWIKVWLVRENATDAVLRSFMLDHQAPPPHAPNLGGPPVPNLIPPHTYFIWDRLGRSGRKVDPDNQHYNKEIER